MKIVRFKGKFTDLIPNGWTFQKLFARNYRQYHKTCDGEKYSQGCRIWEHHGGYLEISDLSSEQSAVFVQQIIDGKISEWASEIANLFRPGVKDTVYWFKIDQESETFHPYGSDEYKRIRYLERSLVYDEINNDAIHDYNERYRSWNARPELIEMLTDLVNRGWIVVEDDGHKEMMVDTE